MDSVTILTIALAVIIGALATAYGLLPERIDLTFVLAAYGAGTIVGGLIAARGRSDPAVMGRRWGVLMMGAAALALALGLIGVIP